MLYEVITGDGPMLVVAGAGSGKTRTLVYRVAWLVEQGVDPGSILLLTFTRRASSEMISRAISMLDNRCQKVVGGTFHWLANRVLHRYGTYLSLGSDFSIIDRSDAEDVLNFLVGNLGFREHRITSYNVCYTKLLRHGPWNPDRHSVCALELR